MTDDRTGAPLDGDKEFDNPEFAPDAESYYREIGKRIRQARADQGMSQTRLAEELGISSGSMNNYESGIRQVPVHYLSAIAGILNKPLHYFLGEHLNPTAIATQNLLKSLGDINEALLISLVYEIRDGQLYPINPPAAVFPFPNKLVQGNEILIRWIETGKKPATYLLCRRYDPTHSRPSSLRRLKQPFAMPAEDALVIAEEMRKADLNKHSPTFRVCRFQDVKPYDDLSVLNKGEDPRLINVKYIVLAQLEGPADL